MLCTYLLLGQIGIMRILRGLSLYHYSSILKEILGKYRKNSLS